MQLIIKKILKKAMVPFFERVAIITKSLNAAVYKGLYISEWFVDNPENFDHEIDLFYQWNSRCLPYWLERGVYSVQALKMFESPIVIELCCGDGFNAKHFYSTSAESVYACDFDKNIIKTAKKKNQRNNIFYQVADIRNGIWNAFKNDIGDAEKITNIIWDAAIEHFTPIEIHSIMSDIKQILSDKKGILSGYTIVEQANGKSLEQHEYEFKDMGDLQAFLKPYFENVYVFETIYSERHNLYFYASDGEIPFDVAWKHGMRN